MRRPRTEVRHPERTMFPASGNVAAVTKRELVAYYRGSRT